MRISARGTDPAATFFTLATGTDPLAASFTFPVDNSPAGHQRTSGTGFRAYFTRGKAQCKYDLPIFFDFILLWEYSWNEQGYTELALDDTGNNADITVRQ